MPKHPIKIGTVKTVDVETGEVVAEKKNALTMLGPPPDKCQECAVDHPWDHPHDKQSLYYQMAFHAKHGRWPTWTDAMAHCPDGIKAAWRKGLVRMLTLHGKEVPPDLADDGPPPGR